MKKVTGSSLSAYQIAFGISFVSLTISGSVLIYQNQLMNTAKIVLDNHLYVLILLLGLLAFVDLFFYSKALQEGAPVGVLMSYIRVGATIAVAILGYFVFAEKLSVIQWAGIALACIGLSMILYKSS